MYGLVVQDKLSRTCQNNQIEWDFSDWFKKDKEEECEELILSQRDKAGQDFSIPAIASHLKVSKSTACRIAKRQKLIFFKPFSTTQLS